MSLEIGVEIGTMDWDSDNLASDDGSADKWLCKVGPVTDFIFTTIYYLLELLSNRETATGTLEKLARTNSRYFKTNEQTKHTKHTLQVNDNKRKSKDEIKHRVQATVGGQPDQEEIRQESTL